MNLEIFFGKTGLHLLGWAFIPTPPSPVPDFGIQFLFSLAVGLAAPDILVRPLNIFVNHLGKGMRWFFGLIPGIRVIVEKTDTAIKGWKNFMEKERHSDRKILNKIYRVFGREDIIQRIIFGYFVSIVLGIVLIGLSIFL